MSMRANTAEDFDRYVVKQDDGCWIWTGPSQKGYGYFWSNRTRVRAHRFSYERAKGPIPAGLEPDHLCRVTLCVNHDHLEAVTQAENMRRRRKPLCARGHEMAGANVYTYPNGYRACRICMRFLKAARRRRLRGCEFTVPA